MLFLFGNESLHGQTALRVVADTVKVQKAELQVQNATKDTIGFLFNQGDGKTVFRKIRLKNLGDSAIAIPGQDTMSMLFHGASNTTSVPNIFLAAKSNSGGDMQLKWWQSDQELYLSPKIGVIGDSQGHGSYASTYSNSIVGRLQTYINVVATNARVINYCFDGYNSRKLAPTGSNSYVDTLNNVTKAIADGNNIIILINTSNDYASNSAGGETSTEEALSNTLLIEEACKKAGVQLLVMSSFPRNQLGASQRIKLRESADNLRRTFGQRCTYVYHLLEDPLNPDLLLSSLQVGDNIHLNDQGCQIVFNALRNTIVSYFTANTDIVKYIVQRSTTINGTFTDFQTISLPNTTSLAIAADGYFYRVRIYFRDGYFSNWSNTVKATFDDTTPVNQLPSLNVGGSVSIALPLDSVTLSATATAQNGGSITSYLWTKVIGGAATIIQPSSSSTVVKGLVAGNYIFRCTVTDNKGISNSADKTVTVGAEQDSSGATKFNFNLTPQNIPGWIDVSEGPLAATNNGKSWLDNASGISLTCLSNSNAIWGPSYFHTNAANDNGEVNADAGGFATDPLVIATGWYSNTMSYTNSASNQLRISGLNPAKKYTLNFYSSLDDRFALNASPTIIILKDNLINKRSVPATGNTSSVGTFKGIKPDANGQILVFVGISTGQSVFGMINGLVIAEDKSTSNNPPVINAGPNQSVTLPLNSTNLSATISGGDNEPVSVAWTKISGPAATIASPSTMETTVTGLQAGTYVFRCTVTDNNNLSGYAEVTVVVNGDNSGATKFNFNLTPQNIAGWIDVSDGPLAAVNNGKSWLDNTSGISLTCLSNSNTIWGSLYFHNNADNDNGELNADAGGFATDPLVIASGWYSNTMSYTNSASNQLRISGLNPAKKYTLNFYSSLDDRFALNASPTIIILKNNLINKKSIPATANTSSVGAFKGIKSDANGQIPVFVGISTGQSVFGMINGLFIAEDKSTSNNPPVINAGTNQVVNLPVSSTTLSAAISGGDNEPVSVAWTKISGPAATITSPSTMETTVTGLLAGTYVFRCTVTDNNSLSGYADVTVVVN